MKMELNAQEMDLVLKFRRLNLEDRQMILRLVDDMDEFRAFRRFLKKYVL